MKKSLLLLFIGYILLGCTVKKEDVGVTTYCNPMDLSYRFCMDEPSRREAADPTMVQFKDRFYLFASKSGGYWHSVDLKQWEFIETNQIPVEEYAPTAVAIGDTLYFLASSGTKSTIYQSVDPLSGEWTVALEELQQAVWDPAFLLDDDGRLYLYWGCSDHRPLMGVEVDYRKRFAFIGEPVELKHQDPDQLGWEVPGDYNTNINNKPWIEGAWVNKHKGKYYLQYSGPGTEFKSYADGVYVADQPLGPYKLQAHNPFAYKPEGFAAGAGHGNTFMDDYGNYWHIGTMTISQKHMFERRLGLFPAFFDKDGTMYSITRFGDYPLMIPDKKINSFEDIFLGWMLLSFEKEVKVSSSIDSLPATHMTDENIRSYWSAATGDAGEYALLDLGEACDVYALQLNFAEHWTTVLGRVKGLAHRYTVEYSNDGKEWSMLVDKSKNDTDNSHVYLQLPEMVSCRYLKLTNIEVPDGHFAISGFRVFGHGNGELPAEVAGLKVVRDSADKRRVHLSWRKTDEATGYMISYGVDKHKMYHHYMLYQDTTLTINSLNAGLDYYFSIEAFNENGIGKRTGQVKAD